MRQFVAIENVRAPEMPHENEKESEYVLPAAFSYALSKTMGKNRHM